MTTVLAAVGGVLLFLLKVLGILLLVVLALMVLLLLIPFCADVSWEQDTLTVKAGALGITFPVFQYPKPEPTEESKRKKKPKKAKAAKKPAKEKKPAEPRKKAKLTLNILCTILRGAGTLIRIRRAAHHPHPGMPWRARGGPCCSGPQLRQAAGMAIPGAGCA